MAANAPNLICYWSPFSNMVD